MKSLPPSSPFIATSKPAARLSAQKSVVFGITILEHQRTLLLKSQPKQFELLAPLNWKARQALDVDAARRSARDGRTDSVAATHVSEMAC
jgi:hypothetical protein